ncbi:collagen alpha-1(I) chain-like [Prinia subflava]|uniref:collagen alpha-1(I) chain-like n=1 Tax=Prinia subflava TaxID=208062 RepID=UPI002FE196E6
MSAQPRCHGGCHRHLRAAPRVGTGVTGLTRVGCEPPGCDTPGCWGRCQDRQPWDRGLIPISGLGNGGVGCGSRHTPRIPSAGTVPAPRAVSPSGAAGMFPHPLPAGKAGPSTQISGSRWRLWHRDTLWPCSRGDPKVPAGQTAPSGSPFIPAPAGHTPTFHSSSSSSSSSIPARQPLFPLQSHPSSQLGKLRQEAKQTRQFPRGQRGPSNLGDSPHVQLGSHPGARPGPPCQARAGQERAHGAAALGAGILPRERSQLQDESHFPFPWDQIAAPTPEGPDLAPLSLARPDPRALGKQSGRGGHGALRDRSS